MQTGIDKKELNSKCKAAKKALENGVETEVMGFDGISIVGVDTDMKPDTVDKSKVWKEWKEK